MAARSADEVKRDLEQERQKLGSAVHTLRSQAGTVGRKVSAAALGAAGVGVVARVLRSRKERKERQERGSRLPFLGG